jgi:ribosomal protein S18 acetylase RimI-like enzyme
VLPTLRPCEPADRVAAQAVMRAAYQRPDTGYTPHPGEWDWWLFHRDPAQPDAVRLIGDDLLVHFEPRTSELSAFGATPAQLDALLGALDLPVTNVGWVLDGDDERQAVCAARGFPTGRDPGPVYVRPAAGGVANSGPLPDGFTVRPLAGEHEAASRSAAARRSFQTKMEPEAHVARYLAFMRSPAYVGARDIVAIAPDGRVASFAVYWVDAELSLAQFEPVGTDPDFTRLGLGRAVIAAALDRIVAEGIEQARVTTTDDRAPAMALYASCGFEQVGTIRWWFRAP